jgi:hypothetical protein
MVRNAIRAWACVLLVACQANAQQIGSTRTENGIVPPMVSFNGILTDVNAKPLTGVVGVMFSLYKDAQGGVPLWMETQNVQVDKTGHYAVMLGSASRNGLPADLFVSGEARWLAVQPEGQPEQSRIILLSVPYALKAGDAETIGGLPPAAFVLANGAKQGSTGNTAAATTPSSISSKTSAPAANPTVTGKGVAGYVPVWDTTSDIVDSVMFQKSSQIGFGTTSPTAMIDVNGRGNVRDTLTLFPKSTDNTLAVSGTTFKISSTGTVTFISGQKFPGTGTITGITTSSTSGLQGGGTTGTLNLSVKPAGVTNAMLQNSKITLNTNTAGGLTTPGAMTLGSTYTIGLKPCSTSQVLQYNGTSWNCASAGTGTITGVTAGTDLTGGGTVGNVTLNLNTTKVPQLATSNTFAATQNITGDLDATGSVNAGVNVTGQLGSFIGSGTEGVYGQTSGTVGVLGYSTVDRSVEGDDYAVGGLAVFGDELASSGNTLGVLGQTFSPTAISVEGSNFGGGGFGVYGYENRPDTAFANAAGVLGVDNSASSLGAGLGFASGVWGDTSDNIAVGMLATADAGNAMAVFNNSTTNTTMYITNFEESSPSAFILDVSSFYGGFCNFLANGTLTCSGSLTSVVPAESNKKVQVYSVQSPENWFEDFGSGQLSTGVARVQLETTFAQTVNVGVDYHVFVTPKGDCKGLYVTNENAGGFDVHELGGGKSSIAFDYRIVARRKGYENLRLADATEMSKVPVIKRKPGPVQRPEPPKPVLPASGERMAKAAPAVQKSR